MTEPDVFVTVLADIDREIESAERRLDQLRLERMGVEAVRVRLGRHQEPRSALDVVLGDTGTAAVAASRRVGNKGLVESILRERPQGMSLSDIALRASERGFPLNGEQVRSAVTYLKRKGQAESPRRGHWRLTPATDAEAPVDAGASEVESTSGVDSLREGRAAHDGTLRYHDADPVAAGSMHRDDDRGASVVWEAPSEGQAAASSLAAV